ncbi:hypothetical protein CB0940_08044 [Cercospora beticola]|uniref:Uncharacterized protein n=1 Tax=Cercospora beticola TaxID=122368 RepID=A0A2G5HNQ4_CERBT|nr:hypothetical protein CB0940_08044 [Cercospora beticola]PIA94175.1 hypothetical protein CB0940_08044 [Cercospora beticola]WPB04602.1 hypothetical protein RHO25_009248 [Cercospora beticola]
MQFCVLALAFVLPFALGYPSNSGFEDSGADVSGSGGSGSGDGGSGNGDSGKGGKKHDKNDDVAPTSFCQCYSKIGVDSLLGLVDQEADIPCLCVPVLSGPAADGPTKDLCPSFSGTFTDEKNSDGNPVPWCENIGTSQLASFADQCRTAGVAGATCCDKGMPWENCPSDGKYDPNAE